MATSSAPRLRDAAEVLRDNADLTKGGSSVDRHHLRLPDRCHWQESGSRRVEPHIAALPPPLWSKPLPSGGHFELTPQSQRPYALLHDSDLGKFLLTSDTVLPTFSRGQCTQAIIGQLPPADVVALDTIRYTIGGMILWPGNRIDGKWTINQARGCTGRIADRFDLTVECIRRHYDGDTTHPLAGTFQRYRDFFDLFGNFAEYVDFWLLDDLVDADGSVKLFLPSEDFTLPSIPRCLADYLVFCARTIEFATARSERIQQLGL